MAAKKRNLPKPPAEDRTVSIFSGRTALEEKEELAAQEADALSTKSELGPIDFKADAVKWFTSGKPTKDWTTYQFTVAEWNGGFVLYAVGGVTDKGYPVKFTCGTYSRESMRNLKKILEEVFGG